MSRSRNVREKDSIQRNHASDEAASQARGKPPRSHRRLWCSAPTSTSEKPGTSMNAIRPARVSDTPLIKSNDALPSSRKTDLRAGSSQIGRRTSNKAGMRCTSSMTTSPSLPRRTDSGVCVSASRTDGTSRSRIRDGPDQAAVACRASVVLPTWRAPRRATAGASATLVLIDVSRLVRATDCCISSAMYRDIQQ